MESSNPSNPVRPNHPSNEHNPTNAPDPGHPTNMPQTRGQNPDNAHRGADEGEASTTAPDDATNRGGYAGSSQGNYDNRDGSPRPEGGGQSEPSPTNASSQPGNRDGYTNAPARAGNTEQGVGSRGGSYNDEYSNSPQPEAAGRDAVESSTAGAASGLMNTGPDQQRAAADARKRQEEGPDSAGASTGRAPSDTSEQL